jgi:hypothetical protein
MRKERWFKLLNKLKTSQPHQVWIICNENIFTGDVAVHHHNMLNGAARKTIT